VYNGLHVLSAVDGREQGVAGGVQIQGGTGGDDQEVDWALIRRRQGKRSFTKVFFRGCTGSIMLDGREWARGVVR